MKLHTFLLVFAPSCILPAEDLSTISGSKGSAYITEMRERLMINSRELDPFGLPQDPHTRIEDPGDHEPQPGVSLADAASALVIQAFSPSESILLGPHEFRAGHVFMLSHPTGMTFRVRILEIGRSSITLQDTRTGERATLEPRLHSFDGIGPSQSSIPAGVIELDDTSVPRISVH